MTAPVIWIVFPFFISMICLLFREKRLLAMGIAALASLALVIIAASIPIGEVSKIGFWNLEISPDLMVFGRKFQILDTDRPILILLYGLGTFWFLGSRIAGALKIFVPVGLAIISILVASIAVEPFLYASLLIELAVLLSIPLLIFEENKVGKGIIRYLVFQTLAVPFILLAGWAFGLAESNPAGTERLLQAAIMLGIGFSFWLAVFPFYSWVPMLVEDSSPYVAGFLLSLLPTAVFMLALDFLNGFAWLRAQAFLFTAFQLTGVIMVMIGGIWAAYQSSVAKILGYAVIFETGFALLALSLDTEMGYSAFAGAFLPRILGIALISLGISVFRNQKIQSDLGSLQGRFYQFPFASTAIILGCFSLAGLPTLASNPAQFAIIEGLAGQSTPVAIWTIIGSFGLIFAGFRLLIAFLSSDTRKWQIQETSVQSLFLSGGMLLIILMGWFPNIFLKTFIGLLQAFPNLMK